MIGCDFIGRQGNQESLRELYINKYIVVENILSGNIHICVMYGEINLFITFRNT